MLYTTHMPCLAAIVDYIYIQEIKKLAYATLLLYVGSATASFEDFVTVTQENSTNQTARDLVTVSKEQKVRKPNSSRTAHALIGIKIVNIIKHQHMRNRVVMDAHWNIWIILVLKELI